EKVWIEIAPEQFDEPYFLSVNLSQGLGEKMFFGGLMGPSTIVSLHKVGNLVQLLSRNSRYFAKAGTPEARAVAESFSDGLLADDRVGYFLTARYDYGSDNSLTPRVNYINRWRLEKQDPAAALSEPKQPIVYWLDRNIPEKYRQTVIDGVLEWNKAFERIGFN